MAEPRHLKLTSPQPEPDPSSLVELGRVVGAHGLRGEIRVRFFAAGPENLLSSEFLWLLRQRDDPDARRFQVLSTGAGRKGELRLALGGVKDRGEAEALRGCLVLAETGDLADLADDEFYWHELIGCRVETREGEVIGSVREIWATGGHDLLVVDADSGQQILVPTVREIMLEVLLDDRRIVIDAIPGLLDD